MNCRSAASSAASGIMLSSPTCSSRMVLAAGALHRQHLLPFGSEPREARQVGVSDEGHRRTQATALASTSMARATRWTKSCSSRTVSASAAVTV